MIKVLIIEDEKPAAEYLEVLLNKIDPHLEVMAKLATVRESVAWFRVNTPELIFMDIHLADGNCFRIFEEVNIRAPVIFTTAYDQYAIKAFKVNSIDYLLKPVMEEDLHKSLEKFREIKRSAIGDFLEITEVIRSLGEHQEYQQRFMVYAGEKIRSVKISDIAYFYIAGKEVFLCTFEGRNYGIDYSLEKIEGITDPQSYFRINRSFIINIDSIDNMYQLSGSRIKIILKPPSQQESIVSFHRISAFKKWLNR